VGGAEGWSDGGRGDAAWPDDGDGAGQHEAGTSGGGRRAGRAERSGGRVKLRGSAGWPLQEDGGSGETAPGGRGAGTPSRKRRRTPPSDWQFPVLTAWGLRPDQQRLLVIIAVVVGVLAGGTGLVFVVGSLGEYTPQQRTSAAVIAPGSTLPRIFHGWSSPKLFAPLTDRTKDKRALTKKEVFGEKQLTVTKKLKLKLVAKQLDSDCSAALWGQSVVDQVADAGCSQAARGLYASSDGRYVGQYTLLNLKDGESAAALVESLKTDYRGGWTIPLPSSKASFPEGGYSEAGGYALGHYVGLVWLGRTDGAEPTAKDDFVSLTLALRGAEKPVYRRVVSLTGPPA
ncbi:hypothetical protein, partial [Nonomuraea mesophila]|uniref:hypothetical protein n=1 Tax=Nonomuraea mesophila TaxID=2530382 RepID=UPI001C703E3F